MKIHPVMVSGVLMTRSSPLTASSLRVPLGVGERRTRTCITAPASSRELPEIPPRP